MTILALYSNKGGVGKTAAAVNLAYLAAQSGLMTLICDLDPQASTTFYFRVKPKLKPKARGLVRAHKPIDRSIKGTDYENLDLLPADFTHRNLDITFNRQRNRKQQLKEILNPFREEYDLIILDTPPTINILAENIFNAADHLLVPLIPSTLSIRTHAQLLSFLKKNKYRSNDGVLRSAIPYLSHVEQMGIYREPVPAFAPASRASKAYQALWEEIRQEILNERK
jgi:cellulose biosynthesis protein BcsQ